MCLHFMFYVSTRPHHKIIIIIITLLNYLQQIRPPFLLSVLFAPLSTLEHEALNCDRFRPSVRAQYGLEDFDIGHNMGDKDL